MESESNTSIEATLTELKSRMATIDAKLATFNELAQEREAIRQAIFALENVLGKASDESVPMRIWEHAENILMGNDNRPMSAPEIVDLLAARGVSLESKTPTESVRTILIRKPDVFKRLEDGRFQLVDPIEHPPTYRPAIRRRGSWRYKPVTLKDVAQEVFERGPEGPATIKPKEHS